MKNISDITLTYSISKKYVNATFKRFYGNYIVIGEENIPKTGPIIFAPNHMNALMDALAILTISSENYATVFLARADMFHKKIVADFLHFAKLMPAFRIRDGIENLSKNTDIFEKCVEILAENNALCIMPEGNQQLEKRIRPLVKGIFRIAFSAQQKIGSESNIKIIPVGLDFGDLIKYGKHLIINIGEPIDISTYENLYNQNPALAINEIRARLKSELENLTLHISSEKYYACFETIIAILNTAMVENLDVENTVENRFIARQKIAQKLTIIENTSPEKIMQLNNYCTDYEEIRTKLKLQHRNFEDGNHSLSTIFKNCLFLLIALPIFISGFLFNIIPFQTPIVLRKALKVEFTGFFSTLHYGISLLTFPLFYMLQTALVMSLFSMHFWMGILFFTLQYPTGKLAFKWFKIIKKTISDYRFIQLGKSKSEELNNAILLRSKIKDLFFQNS